MKKSDLTINLKWYSATEFVQFVPQTSLVLFPYFCHTYRNAAEILCEDIRSAYNYNQNTKFPYKKIVPAFFSLCPGMNINNMSLEFWVVCHSIFTHEEISAPAILLPSGINWIHVPTSKQQNEQMTSGK